MQLPTTHQKTYACKSPLRLVRNLNRFTSSPRGCPQSRERETAPQRDPPRGRSRYESGNSDRRRALLDRDRGDLLEGDLGQRGRGATAGERRVVERAGLLRA